MIANVSIIPLLVLMNGLFVAAEFALVTARRTRIQKMADEGNRRARLVQKAIERQNDYIAGSQLGITMASLALGWVGEPLLAREFEAFFSLLPGGMADAASHILAFIVAFFIITSLHIILGELAPKSVALWHPERTALYVVPPAHLFLVVFRPIIWLMNAVANSFLSIFGLRAPVGHNVVTSEDFGLLASESVEAGVIGEEEARIVQRTFRFAGLHAHDIMVPRTSVKAVADDATMDEVSRTFRETGFTRLPVFQESLDSIIGVIHSKDILSRMVEEGEVDVIKRLIRPIQIVPESKDLAELLEQMRRERTHVAGVVDEYGVTAGIVTIEDLIEEIVGEINSEHGREEELVQRLDEQTVIVSGAISLEELEDAIGLKIGSEEVNTLGGHVLSGLGHVPEAGEVFEEDGVRYTVLTMTKNRIGDILLKRDEAWLSAARR